ncbi:MAG: GGDEF domain-containing protein, partial [Proteobacteria bacterium]|nr:GGDEF domain-containing protein [Pseudomonadota bacterium]
AEQQMKTMDTPSILLEFLNKKILYSVAQNRWEESYSLANQIIKTKDAVHSRDKENSLNEVKIKFNAQFNQEKLIYLQTQNELQKISFEQEQSKQRYILGLMILSVIILSITFLAYYNQRKVKRHLYRLSVTDDLTQVANRRKILELLANHHENAVSKNIPFGLVMIDLDHFKNINDKFGHAKGNEVLIYFANTAKKLISSHCDIGRLGGEEWLIVLPDHDAHNTKKVLQQIREEYNHPEKFKLPADYQLTFSCGILICDRQCTDVEQMLRIVDKAMYEAKNKGRKQDVFA